jgi:type II secretory pathway pseudopilin PulG
VRGPRGGAVTAGGTHPEGGSTLFELTLVLSILVIMATVAVPGTAQAIDSGRAREAAGFVASRLRQARQEAVTRTKQVAAVFDLRNGRWTFSMCEDGNHNGIRRADITAGIDRCTEGPHDIEQMFPGNRVFVDPTLSGPESSPASPDPVRFGASNMASFSPAGSCTPGTLFLRSRLGVQYAIRVGAATGRTRILRYDTGTRTWIAG